MPTLTKAEIRWDKRNQTWFYREFIDGTWRRGGTSVDPTDERTELTKTAFVQNMIAILKGRVAGGEYGYSLRICNKENQYIDERTLPRSKDPKRSKG